MNEFRWRTRLPVGQASLWSWLLCTEPDETWNLQDCNTTYTISIIAALVITVFIEHALNTVSCHSLELHASENVGYWNIVQVYNC